MNQKSFMLGMKNLYKPTIQFVVTTIFSYFVLKLNNTELLVQENVWKIYVGLAILMSFYSYSIAMLGFSRFSLNPREMIKPQSRLIDLFQDKENEYERKYSWLTVYYFVYIALISLLLLLNVLQYLGLTELQMMKLTLTFVITLGYGLFTLLYIFSFQTRKTFLESSLVRLGYDLETLRLWENTPLVNEIKDLNESTFTLFRDLVFMNDTLNRISENIHSGELELSDKDLKEVVEGQLKVTLEKTLEVPTEKKTK